MGTLLVWAAVFWLAQRQREPVLPGELPTGPAAAQADEDAQAAQDTGPIAREPDLYPPLPKVASVAEGLDYTEAERALLDTVWDATDGRRGVIRAGEPLMMLLRRADGLRDLPTDPWPALDQPAFANLRDRPEDYRGKAIRCVVHVVRVRRMAPGDGRGVDRIPYSRWWKRGRPLWRLECIDGLGEYRGDRPLRIYTPFDPNKRLPGGKPEGGAIEYEWTKTRVEVAAIFYKTFDARAEKPKTAGKDRFRYPCLVAWDLRRLESSPASESPLSGGLLGLLLATGGGIAVLVAAFYYVRRSARRRPAAPQPQPPAPADQEPREPAEVDAELREAARRYRQDHPDEYQDRPR